MGKEIYKCPKSGSGKHQQKRGHTPYGTLQVYCAVCKKKYSINPKVRGYSAKIQRKAMRLMVDGMSGRAIDRQIGMSKMYTIGLKKPVRYG